VLGALDDPECPPPSEDSFGALTKPAEWFRALSVTGDHVCRKAWKNSSAVHSSISHSVMGLRRFGFEDEGAALHRRHLSSLPANISRLPSALWFVNLYTAHLQRCFVVSVDYGPKHTAYR
jgi:hypothetical protein